jgi:SAM-dependent methyltransferase
VGINLGIRIILNINIHLKMKNKFDYLEYNLEELNKKVASIKSKDKGRRSVLVSKIDLILSYLLLKTGIHKRLIFSNLKITWFKEFERFWLEILEGRPIDIIDFHNLRFSYRSKFQKIEHTNEMNEKESIKVWQKPENLYLLLGGIWQYTKNDYLNVLHYQKYLPKKGKILEYGCGIAPITTGLLRYFPEKKYVYTIADINQINYVYAKYLFRGNHQVKTLDLTPFKNIPPQNEKYQAITCMTVFEHIPNPLEVAEGFYNSLTNGGVLIFDYILSEGEGLDSKNSVKERKKVLEFIEKNFEIVYGEVDKSHSMGLTIVRKGDYK